MKELIILAAVAFAFILYARHLGRKNLVGCARCNELRSQCVCRR